MNKPLGFISSSALESWGYHTAICMVLAAIGTCMLGCDRGPKLVQANGKLTYKSKPVTGADVILVPDAGGMPVIGRSDDDGNFSLTTDGRKGAYVGNYKVAVTAVRQKRKVNEAEALTMSSEQIAANHESMIPIKYNNTISSGLTAQVSKDAKANQFTLDLE